MDAAFIALSTDGGGPFATISAMLFRQRFDHNRIAANQGPGPRAEAMMYAHTSLIGKKLRSLHRVLHVGPRDVAYKLNGLIG